MLRLDSWLPEGRLAGARALRGWHQSVARQGCRWSRNQRTRAGPSRRHHPTSRTAEPLACLHVADKSVQERFLPPGAVRSRCAKVSSPIPLTRGLGEVERQQWSAVLLGHPGEHRAGRRGVGVSLFQRSQPVACSGALRVLDRQLAHGVFQCESRRFTSPPEDVGVDLGACAAERFSPGFWTGVIPYAVVRRWPTHYPLGVRGDRVF